LERRRPSAPRFSWPTWLARVLLESFFIMLSILLALAVDNWAETRRHQQLARQSLEIFERELRQNLATVEDIVPYHKGLRSVVAEAIANPAQAADMRTIVAGVQPVRLRNSAWQTALASGALTHIDVEIISGLSQLYSVQDGYRQLMLAAAPRVAEGSDPNAPTSPEEVRAIHAYLNQLIAVEEELIAFYLTGIDNILSGMPEAVRPDSITTSS
jgi:hypothetical protein